ncbi:MAG TPA: hypothetical protein PLO62_04785 [Candidatus Hydrogenedentes bacterium]|nr:hypothetical protein [Candidatus Hydrogenedentota bacterium]HOS02352.1 hypothetical protein [Candidatus Hydrogenedentota bacterium]
MTQSEALFASPVLVGEEVRRFADDFVDVLGLDGGEVDTERIDALLLRSFGEVRGTELRAMIAADLAFFRSQDPASTDYSDRQILSVRRGMAAIVAHRFFSEILLLHPELLYDVEWMAKYVQKDTNVEIHPQASVGVPFAIDHGHGTVIGATARIGGSVFLYHGVTLGATGKRSRAGRRHPVVRDNVFFGNGSQLLGPSIVESGVTIASAAIVADAHVLANAKIFLSVRVSGVVVPEGARIFAAAPENPSRFWAQLKGSSAASWVEFERFDYKSVD